MHLFILYQIRSDQIRGPTFSERRGSLVWPVISRLLSKVFLYGVREKGEKRRVLRRFSRLGPEPGLTDTTPVFILIGGQSFLGFYRETHREYTQSVYTTGKGKYYFFSFLSSSPACCYKLGIMMTFYMKKNKNITSKKQNMDRFIFCYFLLLPSTDWVLFLNPQMATTDLLNCT